MIILFRSCQTESLRTGAESALLVERKGSSKPRYSVYKYKCVRVYLGISVSVCIYMYIHTRCYIYMYIYIYIYIYILKFEITPNTTSKLLVDWMFIDDICEHDRLVSAFDCLLQDDVYIYI